MRYRKLRVTQNLGSYQPCWQCSDGSDWGVDILANDGPIGF